MAKKKMASLFADCGSRERLNISCIFRLSDERLIQARSARSSITAGIFRKYAGGILPDNAIFAKIQEKTQIYLHIC